MLLLAVLQAGPSLWIVFSEGRAEGFDWAGYVGYQLGSLAVPLVVGCLGLIFRRNPGLGFFVVALSVFVIATFGNLTR